MGPSRRGSAQPRRCPRETTDEGRDRGRPADPRCDPGHWCRDQAPAGGRRNRAGHPGEAGRHQSGLSFDDRSWNGHARARGPGSDRRGARRPTGRSTGSRNRSGHQGSDPGTDGGGFPGNASPQMAALSRGTRVSARARRDRCRASRSGRTHRSRHRVPVPDPPTGAADALVDREGCRTGVGGKPGPTRPAGQCPRLAPVGAAVDGAQSAAGP